jgi:hypothetical protein
MMSSRLQPAAQQTERKVMPGGRALAKRIDGVALFSIS